MPDQNQTAPQTTATQTKALVIGDNMNPPMHTDGFYSIRMIGNSVHITMFSYMAAGNETPRAIITGTIVMDLQAFLKSVDVFNDYTKSLENAGVIRKS